MPAKQTQGITLIEVLVAVAIFSVAIVGLYSLFNIGVRVLADNRARIDAIALANKRMEMIRNLTYNDIGTLGGIPPGTIPRTEVIEMNRYQYTVTTEIIYIDDPFDQLAPLDLYNADYKRVRVQVTWPRMLNNRPVVFLSDVAPKGIESGLSGGTLSLTVFDADGDPVPSANVHIENTDLDPDVNLDTLTAANGTFILPGMPPAVESYDIVVTKSGYSTDQTYAVDPVTNPNPLPPPASIYEGAITEISFSIDQLGNLTVNAQHLDSSPLGNIEYILRGSKTIGTDGEEQPIYKYAVEHQTNASGQSVINNLEWDSYQFIIDNAVIGYDLAGSSPLLPINLLPGSNQTVNLYFAPHTNHSLLVTVQDGVSTLIQDAQVTLASTTPPYSNTQTTTSYGQTFFSGLNSQNYTLSVVAAGYQNYQMEIIVDGATTVGVILTPT